MKKIKLYLVKFIYYRVFFSIGFNIWLTKINGRRTIKINYLENIVLRVYLKLQKRISKLNQEIYMNNSPFNNGWTQAGGPICTEKLAQIK